MKKTMEQIKKLEENLKKYNDMAESAKRRVNALYDLHKEKMSTRNLHQ